MNKILIVLLATCLLGVHAFVKRDAPVPGATTENAIASQFNTVMKQADELFKGAQHGMQENLEKLKEIAVNAVEKLKEVTSTKDKGEKTTA